MASEIIPRGWRGIWLRIQPWVAVFDGPFMLFFLGIAFLSTITLYSAGNDFDGRFVGHIRNLSIAVLIMWLVAHIPPVMIHRVAVPLFVIGVLLLLAVALFGDVSKGARRWLNIGITRIQPSELMKIAMPMMLAWLVHRSRGCGRFSTGLWRCCC